MLKYLDTLDITFPDIQPTLSSSDNLGNCKIKQRI